MEDTLQQKRRREERKRGGWLIIRLLGIRDVENGRVNLTGRKKLSIWGIGRKEGRKKMIDGWMDG